MKIFCYASSLACLACGYLFARGGFYPLAVQAYSIGTLAGLAAWLTFRGR